MVEFRCSNNAVRKQKHFKPITNGNSSVIALTDEPLLCWKPKKYWNFKCKSSIKKTHQLLLLPKYSKTLKLMLFIFFFQCNCFSVEHKTKLTFCIWKLFNDAETVIDIFFSNQRTPSHNMYIAWCKIIFLVFVHFQHNKRA